MSVGPRQEHPAAAVCPATDTGHCGHRRSDHSTANARIMPAVAKCDSAYPPRRPRRPGGQCGRTRPGDRGVPEKLKRPGL